MNKNKLKDVTKEFIDKAKPGIGTISYEEGFDFKRHKQEKETALWLLDTFGGDIVVLKEKHGYRLKNPDYKWNSKFWELKDVTTRRSIDNGLRKAAKQILSMPGGIIIDISNYLDKVSSIQGVIEEGANNVNLLKCYIIVKDKQKLIKVYFKQ